tara:strand:- start:446 stop:1183 length:738 start_codon:yes stop_codon:yes gene_type:complete
MSYIPNYSDHANCHKCGHSIKYKFYYGGNPYGSTCINRVLGIRVEQYNTNNVDDIIKQIEEEKRTAEQTKQDEKKLYTPIAKKVFLSKHIGDVGDKIKIDVTITQHFWFEGYYGESCCVKMVDDDDNQIVVFTTAKWVDTIENGDKVTIVGTVKKHNVCAYTKAYTINEEEYEVEKTKKNGDKYLGIDYNKAVEDGHSLGFSFPQHVLDDLNLEFDEVYNGNVAEKTCVVNQTQLTRVKIAKEIA